MLKSLVDFARAAELVRPPGFKNQRLDYVLHVGAGGAYLGLVPTANESERSVQAELPAIPIRASGLMPGFTYDNAGYVLGYSEKKGPQKMATFVGRLAPIDDEGVRAVLAFYASNGVKEAAREFARLAESSKTQEPLTIALAYDGERLIDRPAVRAYYDSLQVEAGATGRCLVTGAPCVPARLHEGLRLPKASPGGARLVSFNDEAFASHGFEQGANAPVSNEAMVAYTTALNWLLEPVPGRQHRCGVRLDEFSVLVFWTNVAEFGELVADMLSEPWESVLDSGVKTAKSPWTGSTMDAFTKRGDLFCAAVLSSAQGRAVVRDYSESAVSAVSASLTKWRNSFDRVRLSAIVEVLGLHGNDMRALAVAALFGRPLPRKLLVKAIARIKNPSKSKDKVDARQLALKVIKYMVDSRTNSYSLGRLFAVLESVQRAALGKLNKTIADKHFSRCMTNPALVFPGLLKLSVHHEQKIDGSWPRVKKLAVLEEIQSFPIRLTLEEQGEFALGYAHESAFKSQTNQTDGQTDNNDNGDSDEAV